MKTIKVVFYLGGGLIMTIMILSIYNAVTENPGGVGPLALLNGILIFSLMVILIAVKLLIKKLLRFGAWLITRLFH